MISHCILPPFRSERALTKQACPLSIQLGPPTFWLASSRRPCSPNPARSNRWNKAFRPCSWPSGLWLRWVAPAIQRTAHSQVVHVCPDTHSPSTHPGDECAEVPEEQAPPLSPRTELLGVHVATPIYLMASDGGDESRVSQASCGWR